MATSARAVRPLAGAGFRLVARNRHRLPGGTALCRVPPAP
jgi:predicted DCC family thiol-disulfide oxidoreductase YuxK